MGHLERDSRLKVLIDTPYVLGTQDKSPNGVANFITEITPHLERKGVAVRLLGPNIAEEDTNAADYTLGRRVRINRNKTSSETSVSFNKRHARALLLTVKPDIVVVHEPLAGHAAHTIISGSPKRKDGATVPVFIGNFHARVESLDLPTRASLWVGQRLRRVTFNRYGIPNGSSDGYINTVMGSLEGKIAVSNATADFWNGIYPSEYEVIHNGVNTDELTPNGPKIEAWQDGKQTILFAGRHDERKGIEYLLEAYRLLSTTRRGAIKLKITGEGKMTEKLIQMAREMNLIDVEFVGVLPRTELVKAYRTADVFVSPATGGEGFGRTLAEAMSCGTLAIGSDIDGYREVLDYQPFAGMVEPKDSHGLVRQIAGFLDLPEEEKQRLSREAAEYARQRFSWDIIADKHIKYYEQRLSDHGKPVRKDWPSKRRHLSVPRVVFEEAVF